MSNSNPLIDIGELSKPATVLIEKISEAMGGLFRPYQLRRVAQAEADVALLRATKEIEISELQRRALQRFVAEEAKKQLTMETIIQNALPRIRDDAKTEDVDDDWLSNFFDKCRIVSDSDMQTLWSALLAGEANEPESYSKRTVNLLASLDKSDASLFRDLCSFTVLIEKQPYAIVYDHNDNLYTKSGITFGQLKHLDNIGLVSLQVPTGYVRQELPQRIIADYYGTLITIEFANPTLNKLSLGNIILTQAGNQLLRLCESKPHEEFPEYLRKQWRDMGLNVGAEHRV